MAITRIDDYLKLASAAGFGTFEHWGAGHHYHAIGYQRSEVSLTTQPLCLLWISRGY